uniref:Lymphocyte antigen 6E-like n=1 Tax=Pogona vitticeps TaxID=103695 RepID=A0A6J0VA27_9SAUR
MKTLWAALLVSLVCIGKVDSLWCYRCEDEPSNWNCMKMVKCAETDRYCTTTVTTSGRDSNASYRLNKKCVPTCTENFIDTGRGSVSTKCCESSLCNISGANSVKISSAVMALGTLASFLYIFRSGL